MLQQPSSDVEGVASGPRYMCMTSSSTLAGLLICGLAACSEPPAAPTPPMPRPLSITGLVFDTSVRPLSGVRVALTSGADAGAFATTGDDGRYTLSASSLVSGSVTLQASKEGFFSKSATLNPRDVSPNQVDYTFMLTAVAPPLDLAGEHTLQLVADSTCTAVPPVARVRTYHASIAPRTPDRTQFEIRLGGASFFQRSSSFNVMVATDFARFIVYSAASMDDEPVVEELAPDTFLAFMGTATADASRTDRVISARFDGSIQYCPTTPSTTYFKCPVEPVECRSGSHQLILTRK